MSARSYLSCYVKPEKPCAMPVCKRCGEAFPFYYNGKVPDVCPDCRIARRQEYQDRRVMVQKVVAFPSGWVKVFANGVMYEGRSEAEARANAQAGKRELDP